MTPAALRSFVAAHPVIVHAEIAAVRGSSPREVGAFMLVAPDALIGTIGGGALEYMVIDRARQVLRTGGWTSRASARLGQSTEKLGWTSRASARLGQSKRNEQGLPPETLDIPLGPEIGQCCGGRVDVSLRRLDAASAARLIARIEDEKKRQPHVWMFGAGHVGHALARALAPLPLHVHVVDTRTAALTGLPDEVETIVSPVPEVVVRAAPDGSAFVILTHDHALDFMIAFEALKRTDSPYVGMVGSRTKRARFRSWYLAEEGEPEALDRLVLPIGGAAFPMGIGDKRPEVIATLAAAEILVCIGRQERPAVHLATWKESAGGH